MTFKLSRSDAKRWAMEIAVGDAFSGPAYANKPWAASLPGHRDVVGDFIGGVADAVGGVVKGVGDAVSSIAKSPIGQLAATAIGFYFGGPLGGALAAGGMSLASGQDPLHALLNGGLAYMGGQMFGGPGAAGEAAGSVAGSTIAEGGAGAVADSASSSLASEVGGTATDPNKFLLASANPNPGTMTDVTGGMGSVTNPSSGTLAPADYNVGTGMTAAGSNYGIGPNASGGGGIIDSAMKFAKENPLLTAVGLNTAGGLIGGMGQQATQKELMDKKIAGDIALEKQRLANATALEEWKRRFTQAGSYFTANTPFQPAASSVARRPDGTPVYQSPGLVLGAMNNG